VDLLEVIDLVGEDFLKIVVNDLQKDLEMDLTLGSRPCVGRTVSDC
jgi:hypothetical protein